MDVFSRKYITMKYSKHSKYKNKNTQTKYAKNYFKGKNSLLGRGKDFIELEDKELIKGEVKIRKQVKKLILKYYCVYK